MHLGSDAMNGRRLLRAELQGAMRLPAEGERLTRPGLSSEDQVASWTPRAIPYTVDLSAE